ncbi:iron ABC transporter permease [Adlercreutzia sp. R21]|uniref:FecCD family ABC transporter permease n=1 Tax=Adlercreutzia wanghongyangiae TaxID=3111451 RepID=UPI002DBB7DA2|nr:iron ABC transporter permease [Adlercreutzia sp. R21]MEC4185010.1 iron ABC transporter permease [Adlercreutzia sp. R21]
MSGTPRNIVVLAVTAAVLVAATAAGLVLGASAVSLPELVAWAAGGEVADTARSILENVRVPRVLAALLAGAALATSGALIQASLDNPLASPNVIGVNSGAGLFVLLAASLAPGVLWLTPLAAFAGALVTALIIFALSLGTGISRLTVVLAGIAITTVFGAGMNTILIVDPDAYIGSSTFLVGGLSGVLMRDLDWPALYIAAGVLLALAAAPKLNILALGDEAAHSLGLNVRRARLAVLAVAAVLAGAAVSFAGLLGFVGLVVPHLVRFFVGHDNRWVVPVAALAGAAFVVGCDLLARVLFAPYELPVGILMAFIGGPFFIYLILKNRGGGLD